MKTILLIKEYVETDYTRLKQGETFHTFEFEWLPYRYVDVLKWLSEQEVVSIEISGDVNTCGTGTIKTYGGPSADAVRTSLVGDA